MQSKKGESVTKDKKLSVIMEESPRQVAEESLADMEEDPTPHTEKIVTKIKKSRAAKMYKTATGLEFDCYRMRKRMASLMVKNDKKKIKPESTIYMVAVLEYLLAEVLEVSGDCTKALKKKVIKPRHIKLAVTNDGELKHLFSAVQVSLIYFPVVKSVDMNNNILTKIQGTCCWMLLLLDTWWWRGSWDSSCSAQDGRFKHFQGLVQEESLPAQQWLIPCVILRTPRTKLLRQFK